MSIYSLHKPPEVVDIHIDKILDNYKTLTPSEILQYQLSYCQNCIDNAIVHNYKQIIIVHGGGKGTLKREVRKLLKTYNEVKEFYDASIVHYGLGATEVIFK